MTDALAQVKAALKPFARFPPGSTVENHREDYDRARAAIPVLDALGAELAAWRKVAAWFSQPDDAQFNTPTAFKAFLTAMREQTFTVHAGLVHRAEAIETALADAKAEVVRLRALWAEYEAMKAASPTAPDPAGEDADMEPDYSDINKLAMRPPPQLGAAIPTAPDRADDSGVLQDDLQELLCLLGLPDGARPQSPHAVFQECLRHLRERLSTAHYRPETDQDRRAMDIIRRAAAILEKGPAALQGDVGAGAAIHLTANDRKGLERALRHATKPATPPAGDTAPAEGK